MGGVFGTIIDGSEVENIVQTFLRRWLPTYLAEVAQDRGLPRNALQAPRTWTNSTEFQLDETTQLPAILIISSGLAEAPSRQGDGSFNAKWVVGVAVVVSAGGEQPQEATSRLAKQYGAAIRWLITQHPAMENPKVAGVTWDDENYDDVPSEQARSLASVRLVFTVEISDVMNALDGPILPDEPPAPPPGEAIPETPDWDTMRDPDSDPPYNPITLQRSD
jgi:hypothetical protein